MIGTFLLGVGIVLAMVVLAPLLDRIRGKQRPPAKPEAGPKPTSPTPSGTQLTVAVVMGTAILGLRWLEVDPTWVGTGAFFVRPTPPAVGAIAPQASAHSQFA